MGFILPWIINRFHTNLKPVERINRKNKKSKGSYSKNTMHILHSRDVFDIYNGSAKISSGRNAP